MKTDLTQKQEMFCLGYIETGNASEAYRRAYNTANMKDTTIHVRASELLADSKIKERVAELRKAAEENALLSLEGHLKELAEIRDLAKKKGQLPAAIKAEELRGRLSGLYADIEERAKPKETPPAPASNKPDGHDHLADILTKRYAAGLKLY